MRSLTCEERLKEMIVIDKQDSPQKMNKLIKSEIIFLLKNYFDLTADDVALNIDVDEYGRYIISMSASARNIRNVHLFNSSN